MAMLVLRRINEFRRIGLPSALADGIGLGSNQWVSVRPGSDRSGALIIERAVSDESGARRVGQNRQVTVPAKVLDQVGLDIDHWVYVRLDAASMRLHIEAAATSQLVFRVAS